MNRKPLRKVSRQRSRQNAAYLKARKAYLLEHKYCAACGSLAKEIHHKAGRKGAWLNYQPLWMPTCEECHRWITDHMSEAEKRGWVVRIRTTFKQYLSTLN